MSKIYKYKDYSIDELIESKINLDVVYKLKGVDENGDEDDPKEEDDDFNYNPYDLKDMAKLLLKRRDTESGLFIVKVTTEKVPQSKLAEVNIEFAAGRYNM